MKKNMTGIEVKRNFHIVIPARHDSKRFPGKPLVDIMGKPMIQHVWEKAMAAGCKSVTVATDSIQILEACERFGAQVMLTATACDSGTDRVAQVAEHLGWHDYDIVVNLQGDEPLMPPELICQVAEALEYYDAADYQIATLYDLSTDIDNINSVKVVTDASDQAMYFSRSVIPHGAPVVKHHIGIYAYRVGFLKNYRHMNKCKLEEYEQLEQLRAMYYGCNIILEEAMTKPGHDVNVPEDIDLVIAEMKNKVTT